MSTDFSSLDKLMEFGLGLGVATQMMNTMNHAIANTAVPGVGLNPGVSNPAGQNACNPVQHEYYVLVEGRQAGPFSESEMNLLIGKGILTPETLCWRAGLNAWKFAADIPDVNKIFLLYNANNQSYEA